MFTFPQRHAFISYFGGAGKNQSTLIYYFYLFVNWPIILEINKD